ncbi:transporter [Lithospermum erythrorhizon]|uniref:Nucleoporin autopeptidase n=1 Tax=Lithospermum erythrorhizon TaxID=34254 RepID=A0AAV3QKS1_LITER
MFGSSPFGQSSSSPFGSPSVFGQAGNAGSTNPFAPQPFGNTTPFGSQTGGSPLGSNPVFGATSSAFGSSTPAFGASTSAFGSSGLGQKPAFGGFGSSTTQSSPFGGQSQQSQSAFGNNLFGSSTPFGAQSQPAFGTPSTPAFGATSSPAFGASNTPAFGATSTPPFGSTTNTAFGSTGSAFGVSATPLFGSSTPAFGASSTPAFGASSTPAFGAATTPAFGASNSPFSFGQSSSAFGSSPFGAQSSPFGSQSTAAAFGSSTFPQSGIGGQRGGTRVAAYAPTPEADGTGKLESVSAMPAYKEKSHEELRWEDYQLGDKGGSAPAGQSSNTAAFNQSSPNPFSSTTSSNPFAPKTPGFNSTGFGSTSAPTFNSSPFAVSNTSNPFGTVTSSAPSPFSVSASTFGANPTPSIFGSSSSTGFATTPSLFNSSTSQGTISSFGTGSNFGNTQSSPLFQSSTPSLNQGSLGFGQTNSAFGQNVSPFGQSNLFTSPSTGFGLSNTPSFQTQGFGQATPSLSMPFQSSQPAQPAGTFNFSNLGQTQLASSSGFGITPSTYGQIQSTTQTSAMAQPMNVMNPFGTLPAMPQMSIGRTGASSSVQYGISSLPVVDKPVPVRISSLLTSRHLTQRRIRLPARKHQSKSDGPKVPFFGDEEETPSAPKADALFIPRENPRALVVRPLDQWPSKLSAEKTAPSDRTPLANENAKASAVYMSGNVSEAGLYAKINGTTTLDEDECLAVNGIPGEQAPAGRQNQKQNGVHEAANISEKEDSYITLTGHRAGEAAIVYEHGADIVTLMPKLRHHEYYTYPRMQELAAKESAEPGFCRRVKDFVVGRKGYGSIKFIGETDVRRLDLENIVQFNNREVVVYPDESKKPPVGQGLNKPAEVTLLNIKFFNKKTGEQFTEGASAQKCKDSLIKKSAEQGAEFLSYDPVKGEWKFRVNHFSCYKFEDEDDLEAEL